jgi:hypothetical protein
LPDGAKLDGAELDGVKPVAAGALFWARATPAVANNTTAAASQPAADL